MEEQLFEAIKYIVNSEMEKTETQKFIKSQIVSGKQLDGSYYIEYQGLQMKAYPSSALSKYAQGEFVYVLLPTGNISDKKIIFSSTRNTEDKTDLDNIEQEFEEIRDSIVSIGENYVTNGVGPIELNSSRKNYTLDISDKFAKHHNSGATGVRISALVSSALDPLTLPSDFDYGIYFKITYTDNTIKEMKFSYNQMYGFVYNLEDSLQQKIYDINIGKTVASVEGKLYTNNIPAGGKVVFKKVAIEFINDILNDLINSTNYSIDIVSDKGTVFKDEQAEDVTLTCQVRGNNMNLDPYAKLFIYEWYEISYNNGKKIRTLISNSNGKVSYDPNEPNKIRINTTSIEDINFFECDVYTK